MKENRNNITELVFILDKSGSMCGLEQDTIGGFNSLIKEQKEKEGECYVSTVLFNQQAEVLHDRLRLQEVKELTSRDYRVGGTTALLDTIGGAIRHIANIHKYARPEDVPENTMFVITTDGLENASHRFSSREIRQMIEKQKEKYGWEFLFIGANIDAVETAKNYGIQEDRAVNYLADGCGTEVVYKTVSKIAGKFRAQEPIERNWSAPINEDYKKRRR